MFAHNPFRVSLAVSTFLMLVTRSCMMLLYALRLVWGPRQKLGLPCMQQQLRTAILHQGRLAQRWTSMHAVQSQQ